ncbi:integrase catalytic domain-containing protein [Trichonephila clavata]|uniref:Integrase catalytic domain-containing protein n=1 Tax=Trichonephila clavata TaxID=2740835 RepID=A0A8X6H9S0_TRICU|nr:integrase catalytic domain-containing protein [Trichonephila clavata]
MSHDCSLSTSEKKKSLMAKGKCFICFQNHIRKFCNNNYQKCKICGSFSHNSLICESELREKVGFSGLDPQKGQPPSGERGDSRGEATTSLVSLSAKEINNAGGSVLLQTFSALVTAKPKGNVQLRCMLDGGANKSFILREVVELLDLKVVDKEALVIHTFGSETAEKRIYDIVEITLQNIQTNKNIKIQAVVIDSITSARIQIPSKFIRNIALERGIELADNSTSERIHVLIGSDYISEILENEELGFDRVRKLWSLETIGINPDDEVPLSDKELLKSFEQNTVYTNKRYETRLLWKEDSRELKSNYEITKRRLFGLSKTFEKNEELYLKYDEIIKEYLRDGIIERINMNLNQNINTGYFLPHHAIVREQKDSTKVRIVFNASSKDIQRAFLEIGIVEEDRQFLKFLWIRKGGGANLDLSSPNVETFRYTRVTFGVKCSPFLLAAVIRLHVEKYVNKYKRACEMLNELYVDDLINSTSDTTEALPLSEDMIHILSEAGMNLRRWATNSTALHEAWKRVNVDCRETSEESGVPLKILGIIWDNVNDNLSIDIKQFEKLSKLVKVTKRVILSACGMLFDPIGIMNPFAIRMKILLQTMWESGISWDECVPSDIKATFLEWTNEIEILKQFKTPRLYFRPPWLLEPNISYNKPSDPIDADLDSIKEEKRKVIVSLLTNVASLQPLLNLHSYTNLDKVIRITSYVLRFTNNCKHVSKRITSNLTVDELFNAEKYWVLCVQQTDFKIEYKEVKQRKSISRNSKVFSLNPVMSEDGLLCLGGRLQKSGFNFYEKHPLILSSKSRFSQLLIMREHQRLHHAVNSDNAMTFKSADIELKRLYMNICEPEVQNYFGKKGIKWQYIVERAAWWGGYWERMVQITKIALRKILGRALISFEELQTILAEIEAIINSRPLTYIYNEPNEPFPLTPSNFLTGRRLTALPNWSGKRNIELFKGEEKVPRQLWRLGRIIEIHKGRDGKVRSATIKTSTGIIKRPVQLLYNLEIVSYE